MGQLEEKTINSIKADNDAFNVKMEAYRNDIFRDMEKMQEDFKRVKEMEANPPKECIIRKFFKRLSNIL